MAGKVQGTIARAALTVAAVFVLVALLSGCGGNGDQGTESTAKPKPSAEAKALAVAARLRQGAIPESFAKPLGVKGLYKLEISGPATSGLVEALQVTVDPKRAPAPVTDVSAHLEVYETPRAAVERSRARIALIERQYGPKSIEGGTLSYCASVKFHAQKGWECGGTHGLLYVQALLAPRGGGPPNENKARTLGIGLMSAMISYGQENGA